MFDLTFKRRRGVISGVYIFLLFFAVCILIAHSAYAADNGKKLYEDRCMICHGTKGDGKGHVITLPRYERFGKIWTVKPRDFTTGTFKFRTTPSGCLPTEQNLVNIVENGIPKAYMPSNADLTSSETKAIIDYIKTFSTVWKDSPNDSSCAPIGVSRPSYVSTEESAAKGKQLWEKMKCWECHGQEGRGDGPKSKEIKDDWGDPVLPFDFTSCASKFTFSPEKAYIAYTTGLNGSGMPSYQDTLNEEQRWNLVSYTLKLMGKL
ncbi:c-type cytochrome [Candidatus Magnetomonas plexicatena]|uniref:c-type cytochrome n=1 Tax=Candidatus Magnetomonas plexicatena TaxID=2552947 RepID=UPI001C758A02|nr:cytochrome c [Nitrospirales bacterium LBB_01]